MTSVEEKLDAFLSVTSVFVELASAVLSLVSSITSFNRLIPCMVYF